MEIISSVLRHSFRSSSTPSLGAHATPTTEPNNNSNSNHNHDKMNKRPKSSHSSACNICGKRLMKLGRWQNYFILPCKCRHVFCKQCITGRLACRQKVLLSPSFDLMWTFPCPGHAQCGQQLTVDWSRGSSYSKNLVASDMESSEELVDFPLEEDMDERFDEAEESMYSELNNSNLRECG